MDYAVLSGLQEAIGQCNQLIRTCETNRELIEESFGGEMMNLYLQSNENVLKVLRKRKDKIERLLREEEKKEQEKKQMLL